jgi:alpha-beta hydrolase superfamily lysophospholipase
MNDYWQQYYTPAEVHEILSNLSTTVVTAQRNPIHVRLYEQTGPAPVVLQSHGLLPYGLMLARLQLPFFRAGFTVVQWDLPGFGFSGGPRGGCTIPEVIATWKDLIDWTYQRYHAPIYTVGFAEDGVTCYYAAANDPRIAAMSCHILTEYGDPDNVHWQGSPWLVKLKTIGAGLASKVAPTFGIKATEAIPWDDVFGRPEDAEFRRLFENDPLRNEVFEFRMAYSMLKPMAPPVPWSECRKPIQLIASEKSQIWPYAMCVKYFQQLGGPKELITLAGKPHWEFDRAFDEQYCRHVIRWFMVNGALPKRRVETDQAGRWQSGTAGRLRGDWLAEEQDFPSNDQQR